MPDFLLVLGTSMRVPEYQLGMLGTHDEDPMVDTVWYHAVAAHRSYLQKWVKHIRVGCIYVEGDGVYLWCIYPPVLREPSRSLVLV